MPDPMLSDLPPNYHGAPQCGRCRSALSSDEENEHNDELYCDTCLLEIFDEEAEERQDGEAQGG